MKYKGVQEKHKRWPRNRVEISIHCINVFLIEVHYIFCDFCLFSYNEISPIAEELFICYFQHKNINTLIDISCMSITGLALSAQKKNVQCTVYLLDTGK